MTSGIVCRLAAALLLILTVLACEPSYDPPQNPRPTPIPMAGLDLQYLDYSYPPTGISGDRYVARGSEGEVHMGDIRTGEIRQLTDDGRKKYGPVISERYVAWTEHHSPSKLGKGRPSSDIFVLDLDSGEQRRITEVPAQRAQLDIHGHRLVWRENRYRGTGYDVYAYDLEADEEIPIAVRPGYQGSPDMHGERIAWSDGRNSPLLGTVKEGCSNCPENTRDIYLFDFGTGLEREVVSTGALNAAPTIHGNRLVWLKYAVEPATASVYLLDLGTGLEQAIAETGARHVRQPLVSGRHVVWSIRWACDVISSSKPGNTGLYLHDLDTGVTMKITEYVEPTALMGDGVVIVTERCFGISRLYAAFLE